MAQQDYYDLLDVTREADADALKKAYRKKAMQYHPDRNPGDEAAEAKFKELSMAYDVLRDPEKRAAYDRFGPAAFEGSGQDAGGFDFASSFADVFDDLFGEFMGTRRRSTGARRGDDLRYNLEITLDDAYRGSNAQIRVPSTVGCEACDATGAESGSEPVTCPTCQGAGRVRAQQGFFTIERTCPSCGGVGRVIENPCQACGGSGQVYKERSLSVDVPAGVEDGTRIRLAGEGAAGMRGGPPGDLYIFLSMAPHRIFNRDGLHLYCTVPIPMADAALGGTIEVPTPEGKRSRINIPAGTQNGRQFRLKGKGMPVLRGQGRGDLYIQTLVETAVNLSKRQKDLLHEFQAESAGHRNSPESEGFFARVKELWDDLTD